MVQTAEAYLQTMSAFIVLEGLSEAPFEPLDSASEKFLTLKVALLLVLTLLKPVADLQALSVDPSCLHFAPELVKVILHPRPDYISKVQFLTVHSAVLLSFFPCCLNRWTQHMQNHKEIT